jgi:hypothetical protein
MGEYLEVRGRSGITVVPLDAAAVMLGRDPSNDVVLADDEEVSRRHAVIERLPVGWSVRDLGSRNGTSVHGERILSSRALHHRDEIGIGRTRIVIFYADRGGPGLAATKGAQPAPELTRREVDVLQALFSPARSGDMFTEPASTREMAETLFVSEAAIKQHLAHLYTKFDIAEGPGRRVRLANEALRRGAVRLGDLRATPRSGQ